MSAHLEKLRQEGKPVVFVGDLNCAREEIDIHNPAGNLKSAGFTPEERQSFKEKYMEGGFIDPFRVQHPDVVAYTYWSFRFGMRAKNKGWRLDYTLVSDGLKDRVHDAYIMKEIDASDHAPVGIILKK